MNNGVRDEEEEGGGDRLSEPMDQDRNSGMVRGRKILIWHISFI